MISNTEQYLGFIAKILHYSNFPNDLGYNRIHSEITNNILSGRWP